MLYLPAESVISAFSIFDFGKMPIGKTNKREQQKVDFDSLSLCYLKEAAVCSDISFIYHHSEKFNQSLQSFSTMPLLRRMPSIHAGIEFSKSRIEENEIHKVILIGD